MTTEPTYNALFLCTGNSARSILAEGILNALGQGRFRAWSAGSHPKGEVHPLALATLERLHLPATGYRSKSWDEFVAPGAPVFDFIFTVCDNAAGEACPLWPGKPVSAHWGVPDPAAVEGTEEQQRKAFTDAAITLRRRIELFLSLPFKSLDAQVVDARLAAARGDGEVDRRVFEHPLRVVVLDTGRLRGEQLGIEADAAVQVIDVQVDVKAFHGGSFQRDLQVAEDSVTSQALPWQQCSVM